MLLTGLSWFVLFFILFSFGDILFALYKRISHSDEKYNIVDRFLLGLVAIVIPLSIWSLWLPSNQVFLFIAGLCSLTYWCINYKRVRIAINRIGLKESGLSYYQLILLSLFFLAALFFFSWQQDVYDAAFYHYQNIRWNEEYAVVPGVAALDDRFGFNSNYFLLSAIFSFRFILGEAIYPLQGVVVTVIGCWLIHELFTSKYELKRSIIFVSYIILCLVSVYFLGNTSTDVLPNYIVFYWVARIILYPEQLKSNHLMGIILPVFLLTCKLSFFPFCFISFYLLFILIKKKNYKLISILCFLSLLIIVPWLIRNVIISGYLIYPLYQIDLFEVDWKLPKEIAIREKDYIFGIGYYFLRVALRYPHMSVRDPLMINIITDLIYLLVLVSIISGGYYIYRKKKGADISIRLLYFIFLFSIIVWITGGPDIRFVSGILCAFVFTGFILLIKDNKMSFIKGGNILIGTFIVGIVLWTGSLLYSFSSNTSLADTHLTRIIIKPYSVQDQLKVQNPNAETQFEKYYINNNLFIRVSSRLPYDMPVPASIHSHYAKFLPLEYIEARGYSVQDGFRVKESYFTQTK